MIPLRLIPLIRLTLRSYSTRASKIGFAFDIDGVLKQGTHVLPQAKTALKLLVEKDYPFILVTNGGGYTEEERSLKLTRELGVEIQPYMLVQSHTIFKSLLPLYGDKNVLVLGGNDDNCRKVAENYGFKHIYTSNDVLAWDPSIWPFTKLTPHDLTFTKKVDFSKVQFSAILGFADSHDWGRDSQLVIDLARSEDGTFGTLAKSVSNQITIHYSNPDLIWGNGFPVSRFGAGAFQIATAALYKELTGKTLEYTVGGKPNKPTYDYANYLLSAIARQRGIDKVSKIYMVGDNPASDILGAQRAGWESILVRTGVFVGKNCDPPATKVADDVLEGVVWALRESGERV